MYKVVEIFNSIEGEGKRTGTGATFIRFAGCNLRCNYCDTLYALFGEKENCQYKEMSLEEILKFDIKPYVTLTGGEPLLVEELSELVDSLLDRGCEVNIETNGSVDIMKLLDKLRIHQEDKLFFSIDYKLPSSGVEDKMFLPNFEILMPQDVIKFVVGNDEDYDNMISFINKIKSFYTQDTMPKIYIGCVFGEYDIKKLAEKMINEPVLERATLYYQLHKLIWGADERGV